MHQHFEYCIRNEISKPLERKRCSMYYLPKDFRWPFLKSVSLLLILDEITDGLSLFLFNIYCVGVPLLSVNLATLIIPFLGFLAIPKFFKRNFRTAYFNPILGACFLWVLISWGITVSMGYHLFNKGVIDKIWVALVLIELAVYLIVWRILRGVRMNLEMGRIRDTGSIDGKGYLGSVVTYFFSGIL